MAPHPPCRGRRTACGFVELHRRIDRHSVVEAVDVVHAVFRARAELDAVLGRTALCLITMTPFCSGCAVDRGAGGTLHHFDRLDVEAAELIEASDVQDDAVDDVQRRLTPPLRVERGRSTHQDLGTASRASGRRGDSESRDLTLERQNGIERRDRDVFGGEPTDRKRHLRSFRFLRRRCP